MCRPRNHLCSVVALLYGFLLMTQSFAQDDAPYEGLESDDAPELTEEAEKAIERGLQFLVRSQNKDGSWTTGKNDDYAIAGTSLGLMAFMVEGHFPGFGRYGDALDRAKDYLLERAEDSPTGAMGVKMYEIGLFTIAMSELWGMTSDKEDNQQIQAALERVVHSKGWIFI